MCHYILLHKRSRTVFNMKISQYKLMKGMFLMAWTQYVKLFNSDLSFHLNFDFVLATAVLVKEEEKSGVLKKI